MKIGILTYHCVPNFGAQLQTVSTVGYLKKSVHEPVVLHWLPSDLEKRDRKNVPDVQYEAHVDFALKSMPLTRLCRTEDDVVRVIEENGIDAIVFGSDALFKYVPLAARRVFSKRKLKFVGRDVLSVEDLRSNLFWGGFMEKLHKHVPAYAFSVSSQNCPYTIMDKDERHVMRKYINSFCGVTVRDVWTQRMVENIACVEGVKITPDPVFSFNQNCYLSIPSKEEILERYGLDENYVLVSFHLGILTDDYLNRLYTLMEADGKQPVSLPMPEGFSGNKCKKNINLPLPPLDWYSLICYSKGYVGERMHPVVVSIHNNIPFVCFDEYGVVENKLLGFKKKYVKESSKIYDILSRAGLLNSWIAYNGDVPTPKDVMARLRAFDKLKCMEFSERYRHLYDESMKEVLCMLKQNTGGNV